MMNRRVYAAGVILLSALALLLARGAGSAGAADEEKDAGREIAEQEKTAPVITEFAFGNTENSRENTHANESA